MRLVEFTDHEGRSIFVNADGVLWVRPHTCNRNDDEEGARHVDLCLAGGKYVPVRGELGAVVLTIDPAGPTVASAVL